MAIILIYRYEDDAFFLSIASVARQRLPEYAASLVIVIHGLLQSSRSAIRLFVGEERWEGRVLAA